jgi:hypothetical protein
MLLEFGASESRASAQANHLQENNDFMMTLEFGALD